MAPHRSGRPEIGEFADYMEPAIAALPGFDENLYVSAAGFEARSLADLGDEYRAVRASTLAFFRFLPAEAWRRMGTANGYRASVRGLAFQIAAHERHHLRMLEERYRG